MKTPLLVTLLLCSASVGFAQTFSDNFSAGKLDTSKWKVATYRSPDSKPGLNSGTYVAENGRQSFSYFPDPLTAAQRRQSLSDSFVERCRGHIERMRNLVQILDGDGAGAESHRLTLAFSLSVRLAWNLGGDCTIL